MARRRGNKRVFLLVASLFVLFVFLASTLFMPGPFRMLGAFLYPLEETTVEEGDGTFTKVGFMTPITGSVFTNSSEILLSATTNKLEKSVIEVFLSTPSNTNKLLFKNTINQSGVYPFTFDPSQYQTGTCSYRMILRVSTIGNSQNSQVSTGYFSILSPPAPVVMGIFENGVSTDLTEANWPYPSDILLYKTGVGSLMLPAGEVLSGVTLVDVAQLSKNNFLILESGFPCAKNRAKKFTLQFEGITFSKPKLLLDGADCGQFCVINDYSNQKLTVDVYKFGRVQVVEGLKSNLKISNPTLGLKPFRVGEKVTFSANYTNTVNRKPLKGKGVVCKLIFADGQEQTMTYNSGKRLYLADKAFSQTGRFFYKVSCSDTASADRSISAQNMYDIW